MVIQNISQLAQAAVDEFKAATKDGSGYSALNPMQKAVGITVATGIQNYDLQRPAKNLIPVITPIRNRLPRVPGNGGPATNWIQVTGIDTLHVAGPVPEGTRQGVMTTAATPKAANYVTLGSEDFVTLQAELGSVNFEDLRATTGMRQLWATMIMEERNIIGANYTVSLGSAGVPQGVALTLNATGGTIPDDGTGYSVYVVALTNMGKQASAVGTTALPGTVTITPADGSATFSYGGGSSKLSGAATTGAVSHSNLASVSAHCTQIPAAAGYAWFMGVTGSGNYWLQQITTINSALIVSYSVATFKTTDITGIASDNSANLYGWDGLISTAAQYASNGAYFAALARGTDGTGTPLSSADSDGVIPEIDTCNRDRWDNYRLGFDAWYVNAQEGRNISKKILAANPMHINYGGGEDNMTGGQIVKYMLNPYTGQRQEIVIHPDVPAGLIIGLTHTLPYPMSNVPNVLEMKLRRDYFQMEWPMRTLKYETGVYFDGVLANYFPPAMGVIKNIGNG
jgi:hypothetical protein